MPWAEPKTNWKVQPYVNGYYMGDWFSLADYNRVKGNIEFVAGIMGLSLVAMPAQSAGVYGPTDAALNAIEQNLDVLAQGIYRPGDYPATKSWGGNGVAPQVADWNRWENCCAIQYHYAKSIEENKRRLAFRMNGGRF